MKCQDGSLSTSRAMPGSWATLLQMREDSVKSSRARQSSSGRHIYLHFAVCQAVCEVFSRTLSSLPQPYGAYEVERCPQRRPCPKTHNLQICYLTQPRGLGDMITLKIRKWEYVLDYPGGPNIITKVLTIEKQDGWSWRSNDRSRGCSDVWLQAKRCRQSLGAGKG